MTLPKGFGSGGGGGSSSADIERMIGRRVENMTGMITISYWAAVNCNFCWYCCRIFLLSMQHIQQQVATLHSSYLQSLRQ